MYTSPNGSGDGSQNNPASLITALASGQNIDMLDGVYISDNFQTKTGVIVHAVSGARPLVKNSSDCSPIVQLGNSSEIYDIWFGGLRDTNTQTFVHVGNNSIVQDCVFFNYTEAIGEGASTGAIYRRNKFISCGFGTGQHTIYINNSINHTSQILENILIGGGGYHLHLFHDPTNTELRANFLADSHYALAYQGSGHIADGNIFWKGNSPGYPINISTGNNRRYTHNYHGPLIAASDRDGHPDWFGGVFPTDVTSNDNYYHTGTLFPVEDTGNPTFIGDGSEITYLGKSAVQIDAAWQAIEASFTQTIQQIHDDTTIPGNFAILKVVIDTWNNLIPPIPPVVVSSERVPNGTVIEIMAHLESELERSSHFDEVRIKISRILRR